MAMLDAIQPGAIPMVENHRNPIRIAGKRHRVGIFNESAKAKKRGKYSGGLQISTQAEDGGHTAEKTEAL